jgi:amino acid permease
MTLPFCLASFGYHGNVPSLMKYYGKDPRTIVMCLLYGPLLARKSRKRFGSPKFRVWGGKPMIALILIFGVGNALVHVLSSFNLLPVYQ